MFHGADISIAKRGLYRIDSDPARLRVYEGEVSVVSASIEPMKIVKGRELAFDEPKLEAKSFDTKSTDEFYRWGARRDEYVAQANLSAAKSARDSGYSGMGYSGMGMSGAGMNGGVGSWAWNPWFGMFTYLPGSGMYSSPYGFGYFSPYSVGYMYGPYSPYSFGNGYTGFSSGSGIARGGVVSSASAPTTSLGTTRAAGFNGSMANSSSSSGSAFGSASGGSAGSSISHGGGGISSGGGGMSHGTSAGSGGKH